MPRMLVIEDEPAIADTITYARETEGFESLSCGTGREGIETLERGGVDLVGLDIGLPDTSGFDLCSIVSAANTALRSFS